MEVQYDPTQYSLVKSAQIAEIAIPGLDAPIQQFIRGQTEKLHGRAAVRHDRPGHGRRRHGRADTDRSRCTSWSGFSPRRTHAPRVRFTWGHSGLSFKAIVETIDQKFTLFSPEGTPAARHADMTFRGYATLEEQIADLKLESPTRPSSTW